jgi:hypothetical protein
MCGEFMVIKERVLTDHLAGVDQTVTRTVKEWTCLECDYYEEYDPENEDTALRLASRGPDREQ